MTPWIVLIPVAALMAVGGWLSYHPTAKLAGWFPAVLVTLGAANAALWVWAIRLSDGNRQTYSLSIAWDCITILAYSLLPLLAYGVRLSPVACVGVSLVVVGACLVKWG